MIQLESFYKIKINKTFEINTTPSKSKIDSQLSLSDIK